MDQIREEHSGALAMEEHDLGRDEISRHHDLIDIGGPFGDRSIAKIAAEIDILSLPPQARGRV